jgi:hypothetical protein
MFKSALIPKYAHFLIIIYINVPKIHEPNLYKFGYIAVEFRL